jgi:hypothetical protein
MLSTITNISTKSSPTTRRSLSSLIAGGKHGKQQPLRRLNITPLIDAHIL